MNLEISVAGTEIFMVLGSAAPELLKQTSETLAGRIAYHQWR